MHLPFPTLTLTPPHDIVFSSLLLQILLRELEQCYYCLYGHPHKKAKVSSPTTCLLCCLLGGSLCVKAWGLQDHGAEQVYI